MKKKNRIFFRLRKPRIYYGKPSELEKMDPPDHVNILIKDSDACDLSVSVGDDVKSGQRIGISEGKPVFSTVTGRVKNIPYLVKKRSMLTGAYLTNARVQIDCGFVYCPACGSTNDFHSCDIHAQCHWRQCVWPKP